MLGLMTKPGRMMNGVILALALPLWGCDPATMNAGGTVMGGQAPIFIDCPDTNKSRQQEACRELEEVLKPIAGLSRGTLADQADGTLIVAVEVIREHQQFVEARLKWRHVGGAGETLGPVIQQTIIDAEGRLPPMRKLVESLVRFSGLPIHRGDQ